MLRHPIEETLSMSEHAEASRLAAESGTVTVEIGSDPVWIEPHP